MSRIPRVAVVGSANADLTIFTDDFPRPGQTIFGERFDFGFGGKGANQAVAARLCGAEVTMVARVGDDLFGSATIENFRNLGIDVSFVEPTPHVSTGVAPIFVDKAGENRIIVVKGANDHLTPADVEAAASALRDVDCILLQFEIPLETVYFTIDLAASWGVPCLLNPAPAVPVDLPRLARVDHLLPNQSEAETILGRPLHDSSQAKSCAQDLRDAGFRKVTLTLGGRGAWHSGTEGEFHVEGFAAATRDTTGAGDAFIGSFAAFMAEGFPEKEALHRASLYAALSTERVGTQKSFRSKQEFEAEWRRRKGA